MSNQFMLKSTRRLMEPWEPSDKIAKAYRHKRVTKIEKRPKLCMRVLVETKYLWQQVVDHKKQVSCQLNPCQMLPQESAAKAALHQKIQDSPRNHRSESEYYCLKMAIIFTSLSIDKIEKRASPVQMYKMSWTTAKYWTSSLKRPNLKLLTSKSWNNWWWNLAKSHR